MKLHCAWCEKNGEEAFLAEIEPRDSDQVTHGICPRHRAEVEAELVKLRKDMKELADQVDP